MVTTTITTQFPGQISTTTLPKHPCTTTTRHGVTVKATAGSDSDNIPMKQICTTTTTKRRSLVFSGVAIGAATAFSIVNIAFAGEDEEPKRGTEEAKKKYGPICVAMPTARVCHK